MPLAGLSGAPVRSKHISFQIKLRVYNIRILLPLLYKMEILVVYRNNLNWKMSISDVKVVERISGRSVKSMSVQNHLRRNDERLPK